MVSKSDTLITSDDRHFTVSRFYPDFVSFHSVQTKPQKFRNTHKHWFQAQKNTVPAAPMSAKTVLLVRLQGFEPWTPWLRVRCSTNWAKNAYLIVCLSFVSFLKTCCIIRYGSVKVNTFFYFFLFLSFLFFVSSFDAILFSVFSISDSEFLIWAAWLLMLRFTLLRFRRNEPDFLFFKFSFSPFPYSADSW